MRGDKSFPHLALMGRIQNGVKPFSERKYQKLLAIQVHMALGLATGHSHRFMLKQIKMSTFSHLVYISLSFAAYFYVHSIDGLL